MSRILPFPQAIRGWIRSESPSPLLPRALSCIGLAVALGGTPAHAQSSPTRTCVEAAGSGQALRDSGKLIDARAKFVTCAQPSCPKIIQKDCADWQRMVDERLPTVVLSAKDDAGNDIANFSVTLDGAPFTAAPNGRSTPIDPGPHTFRFTATGHRTAERPFVAREGERARAVSAVLERLVKPHAKEIVEPPASSGPGPLPYVLGGAGLVGAVTFVVLFSGIKSDKDDVVGTPAYTEEKRDELQSRLVVADVIGGVSALVLVSSAVLFATSWRASRPKVTVRGAAPGAAMTTLQVQF